MVREAGERVREGLPRRLGGLRRGERDAGVLRQALQQLAVLLVVRPLLGRADREAADDGTARAHGSGHPRADVGERERPEALVVLAVGDDQPPSAMARPATPAPTVARRPARGHCRAARARRRRW